MTDLTLKRGVASRWSIAQSWWIASELCRRNAGLRIDQDLSDGNLQIRVRRDVPRAAGGVEHVMLNPELGIESVGHTQWTPWSTVFAGDNPHEWVIRIEQELDWKQVSTSPTTHRSLAYRTIARVLQNAVNERERLEVVSWESVLGATPHDSSWLSLFEGVAPLLAQPGRAQEPPLWVIFRGSPHGILVVSESGRAFRRDGAEPIDLMSKYARRHRIEDVVADLLPL